MVRIIIIIIASGKLGNSIVIYVCYVLWMPFFAAALLSFCPLENTCEKIQYVEIVDENDLMPVKIKISQKAVVLLACYFGKTRLIDHLTLKFSQNMPI